MSSSTLRPPKAAGGAAYRGLRELFENAGFVIGETHRLLRGTDVSLARRRDLPVHLHRLAGDESALAALVKLFVLDVPVDEDGYERALGADGARLLVDSGLVEAAGGEARPLVRVIPHERFWIASDIDYLGDSRPDHVAGVHRPSATLARLTVRRRVERALDVGTGNGIQALLLSDHAEAVVATDVNERALGFAEFNAALNGVTNIETRVGSFLEPVEGERFSVVVSNPPYVISPSTEYVFRDSGLGRDRVSEELVRALPSVVEEGGFATVMVSWIQTGDDEAARPREWLVGLPIAAVVVHSHSEDALTSAAIWNQEAGTNEEVAQRVEQWIEYYEREGIEALGYGAIVMRRGRSPEWMRPLDLTPSDRFTSAGDQLERLFATYDFLATDPDLLDRRYEFAPGVTLEQRLAPEGGGWEARGMTLSLGEGLQYQAGLDAQSARIVTALAGPATLADVIDMVAKESGVDPAGLHEAGAALIRHLLAFGYLVSAQHP
jgi:SAM-dependent methyltransferase